MIQYHRTSGYLPAGNINTNWELCLKYKKGTLSNKLSRILSLIWDMSIPNTYILNYFTIGKLYFFCLSTLVLILFTIELIGQIDVVLGQGDGPLTPTYLDNNRQLNQR